MNKSNFIKARSSIVWILAILVSFAAVWWIEHLSGKELIASSAKGRQAAGAAATALAPSTDLGALPAPRALTPQERTWAQVAWRYFETQTDAGTGLVGSVAGFHGATMWDTGSYLLALVAAHDLEIIDTAQFDTRAQQVLASLAKMPLYRNAVPAKSYDARTLGMTDYAGKPSEQGIGVSALDIGRLVVGLNAIAWRHPRHAEAARAAMARWDLRQVVREGQLFGLEPDTNGGGPKPVQEGRLGYEQYAGRAFALLGLGVDAAADWQSQLRLVDVGGVQVPADRRDPKQFGAQNFVVSEPYVLSGLELGWDRAGREAAWRVYRAQEARFRRTGQLTAVTEDHIDQAPFFLYNAVWNADRAWAPVTEQGEVHEALRTVSTKAAFGWHALFATPYTAQLVDAVSGLHDPAKGWYAGLYEEGQRPNRVLALNTNAVVLESLAYTARGPLLRLK